MKGQLKAGALLSYVALFVTSAASMLYTPVMLGLLGQSEYGLYSLASSTIGYIGVLNFGLGNAVIRYTAKYRAVGDEQGCHRLFGMFFVMYAALGALSFAMGIIVTSNLELLYANSLSAVEIEKMKLLSAVLTVHISVGIALGLFSVIILAHERFIFQKATTIVSAVITPCATLPFLFLGYGSVSVVVVTAVLSFATILVNMFYCFKRLGVKLKFKRLEKNIAKEIVAFSSFIFINLIIEKIYWSTDQVILGMYSGAVAVSIYSIGASFSGYFSGFSAAISGVFLSKVSGMVAKNATDGELSELFIRVGRIQYIVISFAMCGFLVFGRDFIDLWAGPEYRDSYLIAVYILAPMSIPLFQGMGGVILQAQNRQKFKTFTYLIFAVANILLSLLFVRWWGAIGCALATALAFTVGNIAVMNLYYWKRVKIDIPMFWANVLRMSVPFLIGIVFGMILNALLPYTHWALFFGKGMLFSALYMFLAWKTALNRYEKELFLNPLSRILARAKPEKRLKLSS